MARHGGSGGGYVCGFGYVHVCGCGEVLGLCIAWSANLSGVRGGFRAKGSLLLNESFACMFAAKGAEKGEEPGTIVVAFTFLVWVTIMVSISTLLIFSSGSRLIHLPRDRKEAPQTPRILPAGERGHLQAREPGAQLPNSTLYQSSGICVAR